MSARRIAIAVIRRADGALLVTSAVEPGTGRVLVRPPGGGVEPGETAADAAVRELREELGIEISGIAPLAEIEHRISFAGRELHEFVQVFTATMPSDAALPPSTDAGHPVWWLEPERFHDTALEVVPEGLLRILASDR